MTETPVSTDVDTLTTFVADLRSLRLEANNPTLNNLQRQTGISRTVLSDAFSGRYLPSSRTIDGIARACGGDVAAWQKRRDSLAERSTATIGATATASATASAEKPESPRKGLSRLLGSPWMAVSSLVLGVIVGATVAGIVAVQALTAQLAAATAAEAKAVEKSDALAEELAAITTPGAQIEVETGTDPALTPCVDDAEVATAHTGTDDALLEIIWSNKCQAGWGRITRYDAKNLGNVVNIAIFPETSPHGSQRQEATYADVQGAYTTLLVRPSYDTQICAEGSFTVDGERFSVGPRLCT